MLILRVLATIAFVLTGMLAAPTVRAQDAGSAYVVSYIEAMPSAAGKVRTMLRDLRDASAKDAGNLRFEVLQGIYRPQQFAVVEVWKDAASQQAHAGAAHTKAFRDKLKPLSAAPYDERPHVGFAVGASQPSTARSVYAVTHVDFIPPKKDDGLAAIKQLSGPSGKDEGNLRYDVLQQGNRPNHLTLVEVWRSPQALERHEAASHTVAFREALLPMGGALFDQRLYKLIVK
jgi:quinol monooxygenase YgiN